MASYLHIKASNMNAEAFKPPDDKWRRMKAVWDACQEADVPIPADVEQYFGGEDPDPAGVEVDQTVLIDSGVITDWNDGDHGMSEGVEIHVDKIPADVKIIRVYNSY